VPGALTFRDQRDAGLVAAAIDELEAAGGGRVAFAVPAGVAWTLPAYELSLLTAAELARRGAAAEVVLVTPEARALEVFGSVVSDRVEELLREHEIRLLRGTAAADVRRGRLALASGESLAADRVIAVPRLVGRRIAGVPADWNGFVDTDQHGRVRELADVYAVGDLTGFPVKQGGIAAQQADVVAAVLARRAGADVAVPRIQPVLRSRLLGAGGPLYLRAELDAAGRPHASAAASTACEEPPWWPASKVFARHLTPWMARSGAVAA
jgi:sulfide:quinone oxidoreductase